MATKEVVGAPRRLLPERVRALLGSIEFIALVGAVAVAIAAAWLYGALR